MRDLAERARSSRSASPTARRREGRPAVAVDAARRVVEPDVHEERDAPPGGGLLGERRRRRVQKAAVEDDVAADVGVRDDERRRPLREVERAVGADPDRDDARRRAARRQVRDRGEERVQVDAVQLPALRL